MNIIYVLEYQVAKLIECRYFLCKFVVFINRNTCFYVWLMMLNIFDQTAFAADREVLINKNSATESLSVAIGGHDAWGNNFAEYFLVRFNENSNQKDNSVDFTVRPSTYEGHSIHSSYSWSVWKNKAENKIIADNISNSNILENPVDSFNHIALSPNNKFAALTVYSRPNTKELVVVDITTVKIIARKRFVEEISISDLCWNLSSSGIAVLESSQSIGLNPFELFSLIAGHPVPYYDFSIALFFLETHKWVEAPDEIARNIRYGSGSIKWNNESDTSFESFIHMKQ